MIIPELPGYLESMGGAEYKGLIIALFTITAMISRPFSGKLADTVGRIPVIVFGSIVCFICSLLYPVLSFVAGVLWIRLLHGFSTGFTPTGQTAYFRWSVAAKGWEFLVLRVCLAWRVAPHSAVRLQPLPA